MVGGGRWGAMKDTDAMFALQITDEITAPGRMTLAKPCLTLRDVRFQYNCSDCPYRLRAE